MKKKVIFIAEAGVNHNGLMSIAKKMVRVAASAKCDYIKFQTFNPEKLVAKNLKLANYQKKNSKNINTQRALLSKLVLSKKNHIEIVKECKKRKIKFLSTAFDIESLKFLLKIGIDIIKIPSGEITNIPYLEFIGKQKKKIILSTGMSNMSEIKSALKVLTSSGTKKKNITILHCNSEYPAPYKDINLRAMISIKNKFRVNVGYSDHSLGLNIPIAALALGAKVIEKHFTLNTKLPGPDHKASLPAKDLKRLVDEIRNTEIAMGSKIKKITNSEKKNKKLIRKSIHSKKKIYKNQIITENDIYIVRPEGGLHPKYFKKLIGKKSKRNYSVGDKFYG